jgi:hypothetical protein
MAKLTKTELEKIIQEELDYVEEGFLDFFKKNKSEKPSAQKSNPLTDPMAGKLERHVAFSNLLKKHDKPVRMATKNLLDDLFQLDPYFKGLEVTKIIDKEAKNLRGTLKQQIKKIDKSVEKLKSGEADIEEPALPSAQKAAEKDNSAKADSNKKQKELSPKERNQLVYKNRALEKMKAGTPFEKLSSSEKAAVKAFRKASSKSKKKSRRKADAAKEKASRAAKGQDRQGRAGSTSLGMATPAIPAAALPESLKKQIFNDIVAILNENKMKEEQ